MRKRVQEEKKASEAAGGSRGYSNQYQSGGSSRGAPFGDKKRHHGSNHCRG